MASGKTANYGLNQWEATDKVERLDFNADNAKVDATLHSMAEMHNADVATLRNENCIVRLTELIIESAVSKISFDVSNLAGQYQVLYLVCSLKASSDADFYCRFNNNSDENYTADSGNTAYTHGKMGSYASKLYAGTLQLSAAGPDQYVAGAAQGVSATHYNYGYDHVHFFSHKTLTYPELKSVQLLMESGTFAVGSKFVLYGLKV